MPAAISSASSSSRRRIGGTILAAILLVGCAAAPDPGSGDASTAIADLLDRLPAEARYVAAVDGAGMRDALGIDADDLRVSEPPSLIADDGGFDPVARAFSVLRVTAVPALLSPFTQTFEFLDLGAIDAGLYAFEFGDAGFAALIATTQPVAELERMLQADGFESAGDGRWAFPEDDPSDDGEGAGPPRSPTGGFPAVTVRPGLFIMASSPATLDVIDAADGASAVVRAVVEGAGASWGIALYAPEPDADPAVCQAGVRGLAIDADQVHALVLGGGEDAFAADDHPFTVGEPSIVGDATRYPVTPRYDGPAEEVVFNTILDSSPFATC